MSTNQSSAWPFVEARKIIERIQGTTPEKGYVLFETGYGPSGLPHMGTFAEVLRTSMVRHAFMEMSGIPTRLYCISDDRDALRKVPPNVPNQEMLMQHIGKPLTQVPDPFGLYASFGEHNNARLRQFLDTFGFEYTFQSSTECYKNGVFDQTLLTILSHYEAIMQIMLPHLGEERRKTYSPFLPICPRTGHVLQVPMETINETTVVYRDPETQDLVEIPVTGGHCKLQWKVDWPMRWMALGVDYEMYGKDLIDSMTIAKKISDVIGHAIPEGFCYEHFLDEEGQKISKSKGNGVSLEDWLSFAPPESLAYYMYQNPKRAKRLYFDVIPKTTDEYVDQLSKFPHQNDEERLNNPVWHIHQGNPPSPIETQLSFSVLLNVAATCHAQSKDIMWGFVQRYAPETSPDTMPLLDRMIEGAVHYNAKFITKNFRTPNDKERHALKSLRDMLKTLPHHTEPLVIQNAVFEIGKAHHFDNLKEWFQALYEILLGQSQGPRMGSFIALYGIDETCQLIEAKIA